MALSFRLKATNAPPGQQCLTTVQDMLQKVEQYVKVIGPDGISGTVISSAEPSVDDRDKAWLKLEANGKPAGLFKYQEGWIMVPSLVKGTIASWCGATNAVPNGWVLCIPANTSSGAPDLTAARFNNLWDDGTVAGYFPAKTSYVISPIYFKGFGAA